MKHPADVSSVKLLISSDMSSATAERTSSSHAPHAGRLKAMRPLRRTSGENAARVQG